MTTQPVTMYGTRVTLDAVIREELLAAWERGLETAPHGINAIADNGAPDAFAAVTQAVDDYAAAIAGHWRDRLTAAAVAPPAVAVTAAAGETPAAAGPPGTVAADGDIAVVHCTAAWTFESGHRMRAARCLLCGDLIGDQPATVIGAAALAGDACTCGGVVADVFLVHAADLPAPPAVVQAAISRGLHCDQPHQ